jgi:hypothetical protein
LEIVEALRESYGQRPRQPDGEDECEGRSESAAGGGPKVRHPWEDESLKG